MTTQMISEAGQADALETAVLAGTYGGTNLMVEGDRTLDAAVEVADVGIGQIARGAAKATQGVAALHSAERLGQLSEVVALAGVNDIAQGADLLSTSEDIDLLAAVVGVMGEEDLDRGLQLARLAGELAMASRVVTILDMPILAHFLADRGEQLQDFAVDLVLRLSSMRALSGAIADTGAIVGEMGADEAAEGFTRLAVAQTAARASEQMAVEGIDLMAEGVDQAAEWIGLVDAARGRGIHLLAQAEQPSAAAAQALIDAGVDGVIMADPALIGQLNWPGKAP